MDDPIKAFSLYGCVNIVPFILCNEKLSLIYTHLSAYYKNLYPTIANLTQLPQLPSDIGLGFGSVCFEGCKRQYFCSLRTLLCVVIFIIALQT